VTAESSLGIGRIECRIERWEVKVGCRIGSWEEIAGFSMGR